MSHFTVGVLIDKKGKNLEELLEPYSEQDCPKEYLEYHNRTNEVLKNWENHKEDYEDIDTFAYEYYDYEKDETTGEYGYWINPNAEWDWYTVGGRWDNMLLKKDGTRCNSAKLKDIDWNTMKENSQKKAEAVWDSNPQGISRWFNDIEQNDTRETYVKRQSEFSTYAVITPDGKWHSKGKMGWFGASSETEEEKNKWAKNFYEAFIKDSDENLVLTIVDCHI